MLSTPAKIDTLNSEAHVKKLYIETLGCQMNENDSELMLGLLQPEGFVQVHDPTQADLAIINTCQIRASAENKAYSYLGYWGKLKRRNPDLKIAMAGCVAQQAQDGVFQRAPYVDMVVGTQNLYQLPQLVRQIFGEGLARPVLAADRQKERSTYDYTTDITPVRANKISAWVTIIEGCDYYCTYCVVPYTRGRQISRPAQSIIQEAKRLADEGYQEITLLGQTVDAYGKDFGTGYGLARLLEDLHEAAPDIARIRFMTSHPLDLSDEIIQAIADLPRVMEYIHIPMQAGSDAVLERMRRGYTAGQYFDLIDRIREKIPRVAISGDFIVGFPGETEADFECSMRAVERCRFDAANTAAYSARKQTPAGIWEERGLNPVPQADKEARLQRLNQIIGEVNLVNNQSYLQQTVEVLVEGKSRRTRFDRWRGRTRTNKLVHFDTIDTGLDLTGQRCNVLVTEAGAWALQGRHVT